MVGRSAVGPLGGREKRNRLRRSRSGMVHPKLLVLIIVAVLAVVALLFVPLPWIGLNYYNVRVETTLGETCLIFCSYSVQSVNPSVTGPATILDIGGWFPGFSVAAPCINCQYKVTVSLSNGQSTSASESKFISNLVNFAYTDTVNLGIAYVPAGSYGVSVVVTLNGGTIATGSGSLTVGG